MLNVTVLIGRLGRHPEIRHTQEGKKVATFRLATSEFYKGEERTEWHSVVCWDEVLCDVLANRCRAGTLIALVGTTRTRPYEDKAGNQKFVTEVILDKFASKLQVLGGGIVKGEKPDRQVDDEIP